jgi:pantoate--beta-alanine ligase
MSSRNVRLSEIERKQSANISKVLFNSVEFSKTHSVAETKKMVISEINKFETMEVEYFEIFNPETFETLKNWTLNAHSCIAVNVGKVRLIDNISYVK